MPRYWIKFWVETLYDRKIAKQPDNIWRRFFECCLMAAEIDAGGRLPPMEDMVWTTHQNEAVLAQELDLLRELGMIGQDEDGYFVVNFEKRQAPVSGKRRVAEYRKRTADRNEPVTPGVTKRYPEDRSTESLLTTNRLGDYVVQFLSPKGRVNEATAGLVKSILADYPDADIVYAVEQAERKAAATNDPPTLEYIKAICERRKRGEPDRRNDEPKKSRRNKAADPAGPAESRNGATSTADIEREIARLEAENGQASAPD